MRFTSETTADGVSEHHFILGDIPGVLWSAAGATGPRPLILLGHGGGQHKKAPGVVGRAHRYVTTCGFAAAAIDAPGHGDRPRTEEDNQFKATLTELMAAGERVSWHVAHYNAALASQAVPEWHGVLDALQKIDYAGASGPVGFLGWGLGSAIGIPFVAAEPRIAAAVFSNIPGHETLTEPATRVTVPVEFLIQWDDEMVPRDSGLAVFDAFASQEKTLHANSGRHMAVPRFEVDSAERFFLRHLVAA